MSILPGPEFATLASKVTRRVSSRLTPSRARPVEGLEANTQFRPLSNVR